MRVFIIAAVALFLFLQTGCAETKFKVVPWFLLYSYYYERDFQPVLLFISPQYSL